MRTSCTCRHLLSTHRSKSYSKRGADDANGIEQEHIFHTLDLMQNMHSGKILGKDFDKEKNTKIKSNYFTSSSQMDKKCQGHLKPQY